MVGTPLTAVYPTKLAQLAIRQPRLDGQGQDDDNVILISLGDVREFVSYVYLTGAELLNLT